MTSSTPETLGHPVVGHPVVGHPVVGHLVVGPEEHGVTTFALGLARHLGGPVLRMSRGYSAPPGLLRTLSGAADVVHLQFTDALYADRCDLAAARFAALRAAVPGPVSVTLHDLPEPDDSPDRYRRRCDAYRRVVSVVDAVIVSSLHEADLLEAAVGHVTSVEVVPLPVEHARSTSTRTGHGHPGGRAHRSPEIGLLGFVHPGKGYAEAIGELAALPGPLTVTALGQAATGHEDLLPVLAALAADAGHDWRSTGFIAEADLPDRLREVAVPLAPNSRVSASGSVNSWLAAGRRPLVAEGGYAREIAARMPGAIRLYRPGELVAVVADALADPASTWLPDAPVGLNGVGTAQAYRRVLAAAC